MDVNWRLYFDRIVCTTHTAHLDRLPSLIAELQRVGIIQSGVFSLVVNSPDPWEHFVEANCPRVATCDAVNAAYVNLGLSTARVLRETLALGGERLLMLEDDVRFLRNADSIARILAAVPPDADIVQFDKFAPDMTHDAYLDMVESRRVNNYFFDGGDLALYSGACFKVNRRGMEALLGKLEREGPRPVDGLFGTCGLVRCVADVNMAIQLYFGRSLTQQLFGRGDGHAVGYAPAGVDYSLYAVPDGYGTEGRKVVA